MGREQRLNDARMKNWEGEFAKYLGARAVTVYLMDEDPVEFDSANFGEFGIGCAVGNSGELYVNAGTPQGPCTIRIFAPDSWERVELDAPPIMDGKSRIVLPTPVEQAIVQGAPA